MNPFNLGWFGKSISSMVLVIPCWLGLKFFEKNYGISGGLFMVWFFPGTVIGGTILMTLLGNLRFLEIIQPTVPKLLVLMLGITAGSLTNNLLFEAAAKAPNPALPALLQSISSVIIPLLSLTLYWLFPRFFERIIFNQYQISGMILVLIGLYLVSLKS